MSEFVPNFNFGGQCEEAIQLYQKAFHAKVSCLLRYRDADPRDWSAPLTEKEKDYIYHAQLAVGSQRIMMCDNMEIPFQTSLALSLMVSFHTKEEVQQAFEVLKEGCTLIYPMRSTTYSSCEVVFIDKFGIRWGLMTEQTER